MIVSVEVEQRDICEWHVIFPGNIAVGTLFSKSHAMKVYFGGERT